MNEREHGRSRFWTLRCTRQSQWVSWVNFAKPAGRSAFIAFGSPYIVVSDARNTPPDNLAVSRPVLNIILSR